MIDMLTNPDPPVAERVSSLDGEPMPEAQIRAIIASEAANIPIMSGRPTDATRQGWSSRGIASILPRRNERSWKVRADRDTLRTLRVIMDRDPDVSKAVENFVLLVGKGYKATAYTRTEALGGQPIEDKRAQKTIDDFDRRVGGEYGGGILSLIPVWIKTLLWQGAVANELQMADSLRYVEDMHPVSPDAIVFKRDKESGRLRRGVMVPRSAASDLANAGITLDPDGFLELPERQFQYVPYHPHVNEPYGMSPLIPVIAAIFFKVELLEDAKMAIHVNGHGRLDVTIDNDALYKTMPDNLKRQGYEPQAREWVRSRIADVSKSFQAINSDESLFHDSTVTTKDIAPKVIPDLEGIMNVIDNQVISGVKQLPILLGRNEGATTTHATVQWQLFAVQVEAFARIVARIIEWSHEQALAAEGLAAYSVVEFEPIRASDRLADESAREKLIANWIASIQQGWADNEEAAMDVLGHAPVGEPIPAPAPVIAAPTDTTPAPTDPGSGSGASGSDTTGGTTNGQNAVQQSGTGVRRGVQFAQNPPQQPGDGDIPGHGGEGLHDQGDQGGHPVVNRSPRHPTNGGQPASEAVHPHGDQGDTGNGLTIPGTPPDQFGPADRAASLIRRLYALYAPRPGESELFTKMAEAVNRMRGKNPPTNPGGPDAADLAGIAYAKEYEAIIIEAGEIDGIPDYPDTPPAEHGERGTTGHRLSIPPDVLERATATVATLDKLTADFTPTIAERFATLAEDYDAAKAAADEDGGKWFETAPGRRWLDRFRQILVDHYKATFNLRGQAVLEELGIEGVFDLANPEAIKALEEFGLERVTGMADTTIEALRVVIANGIDAGDHPDVIARNIRARISDMTKERAETIARTETAFAYSHAAIESYRRNGVTHKIWLTAEDQLVDPPCPSYEDRGSIPIDEPFGGDDMHPPAHPRCVVGDTLVLGSEIERIYRRWHDGELVEITTSGGNNLAATPNHPVLTDRGWIAIGDLRNGDNVICGSFDQTGRTENPDIDHAPSQIRDLFDTLSDVGAFKRIASTSDQFHGDGGKYGDVDIVSIDRVLGDSSYPPGFDPFSQLVFSLSDLPSLVTAGDGAGMETFGRIDGTATGNVRGGSHIPPFVGGHVGYAQAHSVPGVPGGYTGTQKATADNVPTDSRSERNGILGFPGQVSGDQVVSVQRKPFSGHVYNLQVRDGWYLANAIVPCQNAVVQRGIITHNCRCALLADVEKRPTDAGTWTGE